MNPRVQSFEELEVYKAALALQQAIFEVSKSWPREEQYSLTDQARRASRSIGANIAESWAKRRYPAHFVAKLTDADGEQNETRHWLKSARLCNYIAEESCSKLEADCRSIGRMLGGMIASASTWTI